MYVEVLKPFRADRDLRPGEILDASGWRTLRQLLSLRYIRETAPPASETRQTRKEPKNG